MSMNSQARRCREKTARVKEEKIVISTSLIKKLQKENIDKDKIEHAYKTRNEKPRIVSSCVTPTSSMLKRLNLKAHGTLA
jgi:hypothetical protein